MCYKVVCNGCSKYTWGGCGKHLKSVYASIDTGNHCSCRPWPGVVIPTGTENPTAATASATTTASASEKGASVGNVWSLSSIIRAMIGK